MSKKYKDMTVEERKELKARNEAATARYDASREAARLAMPSRPEPTQAQIEHDAIGLSEQDEIDIYDEVMGECL